MLVLTRKEQQRVFIILDQDTGERIEILVTQIRGDKVRLGITAPEDFSILREEVWDKDQNQGNR